MNAINRRGLLAAVALGGVACTSESTRTSGSATKGSD